MKFEKVKVTGIVSRHHSWGVVNHSLACAALSSGKKISIKPTCEYNLQQDILNKYINYYIGKEDVHISYTNPHNFEKFFRGSFDRAIGMCNYETDTLPDFWPEYQRFVKKVVVNSEYCKENFVRAGFKEEKLEVITLGTSLTKTKPMFENNMFNFLNVSSNHSRKKICQVVRCFYLAFMGRKDVCLTIKTSKMTKSHFSVDIYKILKDEQSRLKAPSCDFPRIQIILDYIDDMSGLFSSCDALVSCSSSEGFGLPMLEASSMGLQVICPNYSGQKDFLSEESAFMLQAKEVLAPQSMQYWKFSKSAKVCEVSDDDVIFAMRDVFSGKVKVPIDGSKYSWKSCFDKVVEVAKAC